MIGKFAIVISMLLAFVAGFLVAQPDQDKGRVLAEKNAALNNRNIALETRITELQQTLDLVKRQIQTDRIAYSKMQQAVEQSDHQRLQTLEKLEAQRQLLDQLKEKLESL